MKCTMNYLSEKNINVRIMDIHLSLSPPSHNILCQWELHQKHTIYLNFRSPDPHVIIPPNPQEGHYGKRQETIKGRKTPVLAGTYQIENTRELGKFKIIKEQSSSAGVRRIQAVLLDK